MIQATEEKKLTPKQQAFVDNYCSNGYNGYQAAKSAGYKGNDNTLTVIASQNLRKVNIEEGIDVYIRKRQEKCEFNREQSERELINAQERAIKQGNVNAEIAAIREKNAIFALRTESNVVPGQEREFTEAEREGLRKIADKVAEEQIEANRAKLRTA